MSLNDPTLAEFLAGFEIFVLQRSGRLMAYSYIASERRMQFRAPRTTTVFFSKKYYRVEDIAIIYETITPKKRSAV